MVELNNSGTMEKGNHMNEKFRNPNHLGRVMRPWHFSGKSGNVTDCSYPTGNPVDNPDGPLFDRSNVIAAARLRPAVQNAFERYRGPSK